MYPQTIYEVLAVLEDYHVRRRENYNRLAAGRSDARVGLLLNRLAELEGVAVAVLHEERQCMVPNRATYLPLGPDLTFDPAHAVDCRCGPEPTIEDALECSLRTDEALDELIDRLAGSSAAESVQELASRLRDLERTRDRQIANFARED